MAQAVTRGVTYTIFALLCALLAYELAIQNWAHVFIVLQALFLCSIPVILNKRYDIYTPHLLYTGIVVFIFATLVLGELRQFYVTYWWWDALWHGVAGVGLTIIGFIILVSIFTKRDLRHSAILASTFAFTFALGFAVLWEIYEFAIDSFGGAENPMQPHNLDTMTDLIAAVLGGAFTALFGYGYLRFRYRRFVASIIAEGGVKNRRQAVS